MKVQIYLGSNFYSIEEYDPTIKMCGTTIDIPEEKVQEYKYIFEEYNKCWDEIYELVKEQQPNYLDYVFLGTGIL